MAHFRWLKIIYLYVFISTVVKDIPDQSSYTMAHRILLIPEESLATRVYDSLINKAIPFSRLESTRCDVIGFSPTCATADIVNKLS